MNGYLERLVAQHAGRPTVRSRVTSRFEPRSRPTMRELPDLAWQTSPSPAAESWDGRATEEVDGASDAPRPSRPRPGSRDTDGTSLRTQAAQRAERAMGYPVAAGSAVVSDERPRPAVELRLAAAGTPAGAVTVDPTTDRAGTTRANRELDADRPSRPSRLAVPSKSGALPPVSVRSRREETALRRREPDVVQVHIGRVEVRAVALPPESSRPVREGPAPREPLSLERYLAGERRA